MQNEKDIKEKQNSDTNWEINDIPDSIKSGKDMVEELATFDQAAAFIKDGKNDEAKLILQSIKLHHKTSTPENLTLLHIAVEAGNEEMTRHLIELGNDVEAKTASGFTPLTLAIEKKHRSIVEVLLFKGKCNVSYIDAQSKIPTIDDTKSDEFRIFHSIFVKQSSDWLFSSEGKKSWSIIKEVLLS